MPRKLAFLLVLLALVVASHRLAAQAVPIKIVLVAKADDDMAHRFERALENNIALTSRFTLFAGAPFDLPKNGIRIEIHSIRIDNKAGDILGSAMSVIASTPSPTERGYFKWLNEATWMFPKDDSVSDEALDFLADIANRLDAAKK